MTHILSTLGGRSRITLQMPTGEVWEMDGYLDIGDGDWQEIHVPVDGALVTSCVWGKMLDFGVSPDKDALLFEIRFGQVWKKEQ